MKQDAITITIKTSTTSVDLEFTPDYFTSESLEAYFNRITIEVRSAICDSVNFNDKLVMQSNKIKGR